VTTSERTASIEDRLARRRRFDSDQEALRYLFERHAESVFSVALHETHDRQVAGEITRRVFGQLWRGRAALPSGFGPTVSARRWLEGAAHTEGLAWRNGRPADETFDRRRPTEAVAAVPD
jgi:hypothetical protein